MKIVGGIYREICIDPWSDNIFGSALRSAIAISRGCKNLTLITMGEPQLNKSIQTMEMAYNFKAEIKNRSKEIGFIYETPISSPRIYGVDSPSTILRRTIKLSGINVLLFAMIEANINVNADYLVVDPQGLSEIGERLIWSAKHLALVANKREATGLLGISENLETGILAEKTRLKFEAEVVVIKCGALGAVVSDNGAIYHIPAYYVPKVNPIGTGDVFSGVFAFYWAEQRIKSEMAAKNASRATAEWVMNGPLQVINHRFGVTAPNAEEEIIGQESRVYLAAPFFTVAERWLLNLCRNGLMDIGATVFSPLHDVGVGNTDLVGLLDLEGLSSSNSILALLDGMDSGTLFEVGYGNALKKPIIVYIANKRSKKLTMLRSNNIHIHDNLASAIYDAVWAGIQK